MRIKGMFRFEVIKLGKKYIIARIGFVITSAINIQIIKSCEPEDEYKYDV